MAAGCYNRGPPHHRDPGLRRPPQFVVRQSAVHTSVPANSPAAGRHRDEFGLLAYCAAGPLCVPHIYIAYFVCMYVYVHAAR